jgi:hypothetical protein
MSTRDEDIAKRIDQVRGEARKLAEDFRVIAQEARASEATGHERLYYDAEHSMTLAWEDLDDAFKIMAHGDPADYAAGRK